jgi:diguanylate cyclase
LRTCGREEVRCRDIGQRLSLILIDLDGLKSINDRDGHAAGDELIQCAAWTLREVLRNDAHLARPGGDEFVALLTGCAMTEALKIGERFRVGLAGRASRLRWLRRTQAASRSGAPVRADVAMHQDKIARRSQ